MSRPICPGSRRAVPIPATERFDADHWANCEKCGVRLQLRNGCFPLHRHRKCLAPGCESHQTRGGLCSEHNKEIVGVDAE